MGLDLSRDWAIGGERTKSSLLRFLEDELVIAAAET